MGHGTGALKNFAKSMAVCTEMTDDKGKMFIRGLVNLVACFDEDQDIVW